ncbi:hypothetical protein [Xanthomonas medicagonis]|uniref:hypothetical protein n=1 Tax=Xanthomonas medicagonis TaxID=3160841 RepID=UPI0035191377
MILWGWGERDVACGVEDRQFCARCAQERAFEMRLRYSYGHFYHLFGWVRERQYLLICPECHHGWLLNRASAEALLPSLPIPFHQRWGWLVMLVLAVLIAAAALLHGANS